MSRNVWLLSEPTTNSQKKPYVPWWMYANVFSFDAPIIAVVWLYVFSWIWDVNYVEPFLLLLPVSYIHLTLPTKRVV